MHGNVNMESSKQTAKFLQMGILTVVAVYLLILVGGVVRASGSGMGCPDWPTCFGRWIPPTSESQLPADYHQRYIGYGDTTFNALKTWTEYLNRLLGASIGLMVLGTLLRASALRKQAPTVFKLALSAFLLVGFQGWLGSRVVASELKPILISAHMLTAFLIVSILILSVCLAAKERIARIDLGDLGYNWRRTLGIALVLTLLQVAMGTQIRESVDAITNAQLIPERTIWREHFPIIFYIHRSFSSVILFTNLWIGWQVLRKTPSGNPLRIPALLLMILVSSAVLSGVTLDRLGFPALAQPLHLLLANLIFGTQLVLYISSHLAGAGSRPHSS